MSFFLKIGLPWAVSLGIVFFIGLELGKENDDLQNLNISDKGEEVVVSRDLFPKKNISKLSTKKKGGKINPPIFNPAEQTPSLTYSPPLPPNLRRIMEDGSMVERMGSYMDALRIMDPSNLGQVIDAFEALPKGYGRHLEMKLLMRSWAEFDPMGALQYSEESLDQKSEKRFAMTEVLAGWAARDSESAIEWVKQNQSDSPDSSESASLLIGVVKGLAENDLEGANNFSNSLANGSAKWQASTFLAQEYAKLGTQKAIQWAESFPQEDERMRATILGQLGAKLAQDDLDGTANWVESMPIDKASEQVMSNLLSRWSAKSPLEAAAWANQLENPEKKVQAMKLLTNKWSLRDPVATASWLNKFPPSTELDPVVGEFVNRISSRDPEGAIGWASSIINEEQKNRAIGQVLRAWERKDPEKAKSWRLQNGVLETSVNR